MEQPQITKENYDKFIQLAKEMNLNGDGGEEFTFALESLARIVDIAYCEGQMAEMMIDDGWAEDANKIARYGALQQQIENAMPDGFVEIES